MKEGIKKPKSTEEEKEIKINQLINKEKYDREDIEEVRKIMKELKEEGMKLNEQGKELEVEVDKLESEFSALVIITGFLSLGPKKKEVVKEILEKKMPALGRKAEPIIERHLYLSNLAKTLLKNAARGNKEFEEIVNGQQEIAQLGIEALREKLNNLKELQEIVSLAKSQ